MKSHAVTARPCNCPRVRTTTQTKRHGAAPFEAVAGAPFEAVAGAPFEAVAAAPFEAVLSKDAPFEAVLSKDAGSGPCLVKLRPKSTPGLDFGHRVYKNLSSLSLIFSFFFSRNVLFSDRTIWCTSTSQFSLSPIVPF